MACGHYESTGNNLGHGHKVLFNGCYWKHGRIKAGGDGELLTFLAEAELNGQLGQAYKAMGNTRS